MRLAHTASRLWRQALALISALLITTITAAPLASADTAPPAGTPATVSADALPTVQINGIVWKQAIYGNKVYATGQFTEARPAGVAVGGAGSVTRTNLLAYDITTGQLDTSFVHSLSGGTKPEGRAIAVSPDGTRLYVGGTFTTVDGQAHSDLAAFDLNTNKVLPGFNVNGAVHVIAATNTQVYVGGAFSQIGSVSRKLVAAFNSDGTVNTSWKADVTGLSGSHVNALVAVPSAGNLIIGGSFNAINGKTYYSNGAVKLATGADVTPWASQSSSFPIRMQPPSGQSGSGLGITSLSTDNTQAYLTAFTFISVPHPGSFEGTAAINPTNGTIITINDCAGDTYDAFPIGQVLYSVSHAHNCTPIMGYPGLDSAHYQHALAETTYATGTDGPGMGGNYPSFQGQPRGDLLNWFPQLTTANVSGSNQAAWSVVGNSQFVALGGEFPKANNVPQQGLVRYAVSAKAPNELGPNNYFSGSYGVTAQPADSTGKSIVRVFNTSDPDNGTLTYKVYRKGSSTVLASHDLDSRFWRADSWTFTDTGLAPGTSAQYTVVVTDPNGNSRTFGDDTVFDDTDARISYSGSWTNSQNRTDAYQYFQRGIHYSMTNGDSYSFSFYGSAIQLLGTKASSRGGAAITIDGVSAGQYDASSSTGTGYQQVLFSTSGLGFGKHTIKVTKTSGTYLEADAIHVTQDKFYDDNGSAVTYANPSNWTSRQNSATIADFGKGIHYTKVNGESATVAFSGTSVALMSEKNSGRGDVSVSIDGGAPVTVSEYAASGTALQQIIFTKTGLAAGAHTLKVTKLSGTYMDIDAVFSR